MYVIWWFMVTLNYLMRTLSLLLHAHFIKLRLNVRYRNPCTNDKSPQRDGTVPFAALGRVEMACQFPEGLIFGRFFHATFLIFYPCCPLRGHLSTAFLNPNDRPPIFYPDNFLVSSPTQTFSLSILLTAAYPYASSHQRWHSSPPRPYRPLLALSAPVESPGETDRYNVPTVLSGYTSPVPVSLSQTSANLPRTLLDLSNMPTLSHPNPVSSSTNTLNSNPHLHLQILTNPYL